MIGLIESGLKTERNFTHSDVLRLNVGTDPYLEPMLCVGSRGGICAK